MIGGQRSKRGFRSYLFSSFFGAAMIAATYAYFNYKFSQFHYFDFDNEHLYMSRDIFTPEQDDYTVLIYSSKKDDLGRLMKKVNEPHRFLAIDLAGERGEADAQVVRVTAGINTLLPLINRFKIMSVPVVFDIKREKFNRFKQASKLEYFQ